MKLRANDDIVVGGLHKSCKYQPNQKHLGCKKGRGQEEAALVGLHATKMFDITEGQEVLDTHSTHSISYFTHVYASEFHNYD